MIKRILPILLLLCLIITLAACSGSTDNTAGTEHEDNNTPWETILFGSYEQDGNLLNGPEPIEWIVLKKEGSKMLLLSSYVLEARPYSTEWAPVAVWETCTLRSWLNETFYADAFNDTERGKIMQVNLENAGNAEYETPGGNNTDDFVFLLSLADVVDPALGFDPDADAKDSLRRCFPTAFAIASGCYVCDYKGSEGTCRWWLRSPGMDSMAADVYDSGYVYICGDSVTLTEYGVRPAIMIDMDGATNIPTRYSETQHTDTAPDDSTIQTATNINVGQISCGSQHAVFVREDGTLFTWGSNKYGQLCRDDLEWSDVPLAVMDNVAAASCGLFHTAAVKTDGSLWTWGINASGQLGNGESGVVFSSQPVKVMEDVASVSCGGDITLALKTDGTLWACGSNFDGQLGNGEMGRNLYSSVPIKVMDDVSTVCATGSDHVAVIKTDGSLWLWGYNGYGTIGNGEQDNNVLTPVKIMENVVFVSLCTENTAAITSDGSLWMWGSNYDAQISGALERDIISSPVKVMDDVASVALGFQHTAALKTDGSLWMWGSNRYAQIGNGTAIDVNGNVIETPFHILDDVSAVACGTSFTIAIKADGTLWGWGRNDVGQVGNGLGGYSRRTVEPRQITGVE